ncbi:MAG TPA: hypothetical protein VMT30_01600 [Candidatus Saccharimonadia bacterium]|nr:hypothetical protein [Candidatus Saccharimonadia bacterium]
MASLGTETDIHRWHDDGGPDHKPGTPDETIEVTEANLPTLIERLGSLLTGHSVKITVSFWRNNAFSPDEPQSDTIEAVVPSETRISGQIITKGFNHVAIFVGDRVTTFVGGVTIKRPGDFRITIQLVP